MRVENVGDADAGETRRRVRVVDGPRTAVLDTEATLPAVAAGGEASLLAVRGRPPAAGQLRASAVEVDPDGRVAETSEGNNAAEREVVVVAEEGLGGRDRRPIARATRR